jgi:uncharacterized membrane protein
VSDIAPAKPLKPGPSWLLIASLALNLLIIGLIAGAAIARHRLAGQNEFNVNRLAGEPGLRGFMRQLPKERRVVIRQAIEPGRETLKTLRQSARKARDSVQLALAAQPFDKAALEKALIELTAAEGAVGRSNATALADAISLMTPAERLQFQAWRRTMGVKSGPFARPAEPATPDDVATPPNGSTVNPSKP